MYFAADLLRILLCCGIHSNRCGFFLADFVLHTCCGKSTADPQRVNVPLGAVHMADFTPKSTCFLCWKICIKCHLILHIFFHADFWARKTHRFRRGIHVLTALKSAEWTAPLTFSNVYIKGVVSLDIDGMLLGYATNIQIVESSRCDNHRFAKMKRQQR